MQSLMEAFVSSSFSNQYVQTREESYRECDENYVFEHYKKGRYRIITCKDSIQWILQVRSGKKRAGARWRALGYFVERDSLIRASRAYFGAPTPLERLELPEFFKRGEE